MLLYPLCDGTISLYTIHIIPFQTWNHNRQYQHRLTSESLSNFSYKISVRGTSSTRITVLFFFKSLSIFGRVHLKFPHYLSPVAPSTQLHGICPSIDRLIHNLYAQHLRNAFNAGTFWETTQNSTVNMNPWCIAAYPESNTTAVNPNIYSN